MTIVSREIFKALNPTSVSKGNNNKYRTLIIPWRQRNSPQIKLLKRKQGL